MSFSVVYRFGLVLKFSILVLVFAGAQVSILLFKPFDFSGDIIFRVEKDSSCKEIISGLSNHGIIRKPLALSVVVNCYCVKGKFFPGEYRFSSGISPIEAIDKIKKRQSIKRKLVINSSTTVSQIIEKLYGEEGLFGDIDYRVISEGMIYPDTYVFSYGDSRNDLLLFMRNKMDKFLQNKWENRSTSVPFNNSTEALTLASIVEKEAGQNDDMSHIAGVFVNRLKKRMRLQADPTVIYAMTGGNFTLERPLYKQDLAIEHPYNTYRNFGLPPAPIAIPSLKALEAALHPLDTDDLYFVADGKGGHYFARNLSSHNKNVKKSK